MRCNYIKKEKKITDCFYLDFLIDSIKSLKYQNYLKLFVLIVERVCLINKHNKFNYFRSETKILLIRI